jgi:hypothetical protein
MTFAFGMNETFRDVYAKDDAVLRFGLMEKEWNGRNKEAQIAAIRALQAREHVVIAIGNRIAVNNFDQWLKELDRVTDHVNVQRVHLKFMLVDPLSDHPIVVTGSANFSEASTKTNDENMLVIKDNTRVADIYLGEYMRLYFPLRLPRGGQDLPGQEPKRQGRGHETGLPDRGSRLDRALFRPVGPERPHGPPPVLRGGRVAFPEGIARLAQTLLEMQSSLH